MHNTVAVPAWSTKYCWEKVWESLFCYICSLSCSHEESFLHVTFASNSAWNTCKQHILLPQHTCIYTMRAFTWDWLIIQTKLIQQVTFAVSTPNVWGMIDQLIIKNLQPWASKPFCTLAREVDRCKFGFHIMFGPRVIRMLILGLQLKQNGHPIGFITLLALTVICFISVCVNFNPKKFAWKTFVIMFYDENISYRKFY